MAFACFLNTLATSVTVTRPTVHFLSLFFLGRD
uniref:Uncharacterized protein n=1 Tax=Arundo donax TaxID=35708 RepID=A0A0A8YPC7_ARUDO